LSEYLTKTLLTQKQIKEGCYIIEDDHCFYLHKGKKQLLVFSIHTNHKYARLIIKKFEK
jgi:hypothetical protein